MSNNLWQRLGAASGIVYVVVILAPDLIPRDQSEELTMTAAEAIAQSCAITTAAQLTDAIYPITHILGYLFFLFFLGSLWSALRRTEGGDGWLSAAAFGGGLVSLAIRLSSATVSLAAVHNSCAGIDPQLWQVLTNDVGGAALFLSFFPLAILSVACAVVAIRFGAPLPRWLGWMSAVVAVALLVDGIAGTLYHRDFGPSFLLFMVWTLAASIALVRRAGQPLPTVESALTSPANKTG
jgi:hypothetical protein